MCGIIGAIAERNVIPILLEGLKRLEYRGYDSAGVAVLNSGQRAELLRLRVVGKIKNLENAIIAKPVSGHVGVAHTRWATHGVPSVQNAHPHISKDLIAVVHNGIIENYRELRVELTKDGYEFQSETDTEVVAHLLHKFHEQGESFLSAVHKTVQKLVGMYALAILNSQDPERIIGVQAGNPLVVGLGMGENYLASDPLALTPVTQKFIYLAEGDIVDITREKIIIYDPSLELVERPVHSLEISQDLVDKGVYRHFMQKEIFEEPRAVADTMCFGDEPPRDVPLNLFSVNAAQIFPKIKRIQIIACGTSYHAGLVARYWLEEIANLPCQVEIASEFRYKKNIVEPNTLCVAISQSGETADTLAGLRRAKELNYAATLAICNVAESTLMREAKLRFLTRAGVEIGVASTKAFTAQLVALFLLSLSLRKFGGARLETCSYQEEENKYISSLLADLHSLPSLIELCLDLDTAIFDLAKRFADKTHALYLGRGSCYPIALEGALKLKEISYIHAEAYAAGELKHGPLALIDKNMPVIILAPSDELSVKMQNNIKEVEARGGELIVFSDCEDLGSRKQLHVFKMPKVANSMIPVVYTIPLQLLAYHVAVLKGTDVDQPRHLAKSVTVE